MEIVKYRAVEGTGNTVAYISLKVPRWDDMVIANCRVVRTDKGAFFVGLPNQPYEVDGQTKYNHHLWLEKPVMEAFQKAARTAINEYIKKNTITNPEPQHEPVSSNDGRAPF